MKPIVSAFLCILLVHLACGVKQPVGTIQDEQSGKIFVTSSPPGAQIFLDGINTGLVTPDTVKHVLPGLHTIRTFLKDHQATPDSFAIVVENEQVQTVRFTFYKIEQAGFVNISSFPNGAWIYIDEKPSGEKTPALLRLEPGPHFITIEKNGFQ